MRGDMSCYIPAISPLTGSYMCILNTGWEIRARASFTTKNLIGG